MSAVCLVRWTSHAFSQKGKTRDRLLSTELLPFYVLLSGVYGVCMITFLNIIDLHTNAHRLAELSIRMID